MDYFAINNLVYFVVAVYRLVLPCKVQGHINKYLFSPTYYIMTMYGVLRRVVALVKRQNVVPTISEDMQDKNPRSGRILLNGW